MNHWFAPGKVGRSSRLDTKCPHAFVTKEDDPAEVDFLKGEILSLTAAPTEGHRIQPRKYKPDFSLCQ
jgi:hypothetical protein